MEALYDTVRLKFWVGGANPKGATAERGRGRTVIGLRVKLGCRFYLLALLTRFSERNFQTLEKKWLTPHVACHVN